MTKRKILTYSLFLVLLPCLAGCGAVRRTAQAEDFAFLHQPDSYLSAGQLDMKVKVLDAMYSKTEVRGERLVFTGIRKYFKDRDIPLKYRSMLKRDLRQSNRNWERMPAFSGSGIDKAASWEKSSREFYRQYGTRLAAPAE